MTDTVERPSPAAEVRAYLDALRVTPENVLLIGNALQAEAILLNGRVRQARADTVVREPGRDPVSVDAVPRFNAKITDLLTECQVYVNALAEAAAQMAQTARRYGHTEQEITDSFTRYQIENTPPTIAPPMSAPRPS
jgi:hypothetical protein